MVPKKAIGRRFGLDAGKTEGLPDTILLRRKTMTSNVRDHDQPAQPPAPAATPRAETPAGRTLGRRSLLRRGVIAAAAFALPPPLPGRPHPAPPPVPHL